MGVMLELRLRSSSWTGSGVFAVTGAVLQLARLAPTQPPGPSTGVAEKV